MDLGISKQLERLTGDQSVRPHSVLELIQKAGAATDQKEYEGAFADVFATLATLDAELAARRFLDGNDPGPRDWGLFVVLVRFDLVYYGLYKCNRTRLVDFPNLGGWLRDLYQRPDVSATIDLRDVQREAYTADAVLNPAGTVPVALPDLDAPHDRRRFDREAQRRVGVEQDQRSGPVGAFKRGRSGHRGRLSADGSSGFRAEPSRYHLYIANNCPWCHRVALARSMRGLDEVVSMDVLHFRRDPERGWRFRPDLDGFDADSVNGLTFVKELYERLGSTEKSVPVLWDRHTETIVNNESAEIMRDLDGAFGHWASGTELYPPEHRDEIDRLNAWIYQDVNNGAYRAGFSSDQATYEAAFKRFFSALDRLDGILSERSFLCGDEVTEADVRLFPTIFRFDHVYYTRMKLNARMVTDYRSLSRWRSDFWALPGVKKASNLEHCINGYFGRSGNEIVPAGPDLEFPAT